MKLRDLFIAAIVLAVLLGILYWSNHRKQGEDSSVKASPSPNAPVKILSLNQAELIRLAIHRKGEPQVDLSRDASGTWQITRPKPFPADQGEVSSLLSTLSSLNSDRLLEEKTADLAPYGLANPSLELDIAFKDNKTKRLLIGDATPTGNAYYLMLAGDPRLFTAASYSKSSLDKSVSDLRDKRLLTADFDKVSQIELINEKPGKEQDITFARNKDAWQILKPKSYRADAGQVDALITSLKDAKMDAASASEDINNAAAFKSAAPFAIAKITGASGTQELEIRKRKDDYYAKSSVLSGIYKVSANVGVSLDKSLDNFRNKRLLDFGYQDPDKLEIHDGSKSYFLARSGSDWWGADGKKLDEASVQLLISKIRELSASKFPDSGFSTPTLEITITSNARKHIEKVFLAKGKVTYIAKRESEPELYELPASSVEELQKSAADLKPASEPKK
jgi:hypothetical protein